MFNLFNKKPLACPVSVDTQEWIQKAFYWLCVEFGMDTITNKKVFIPDYDHFPILYNGEHKTAFDTLTIVANQMDINPNEIELKLYSEGISEIKTGGLGGKKIFIGHEKDANKSSGKYHGKNDDGKFHISLEEGNLKDPEGMVATLAHELAHIKLLGENRLDDNNEHLTDLTTIIYGFGIFNANASFRFNSGFDQWGYRKIGYLSQIEWGYSLAAYSALKNEISPKWTTYLSETVKGSYKKSEQFINANK